jgi:hypothetical protein
VSGILLSKTFGSRRTRSPKFRPINTRPCQPPDPPGDGRSLVLHDHRHGLLDHAAFVYWLAAARWAATGPRRNRRQARSSLSPRSRAGCFFPLVSCWQRQVEIQGSLAAVRPIFEYLEMDPRSSMRPTRWPDAHRRARSAFRDVSFHYPTAVVPRTAHAARRDASEEAPSLRRGGHRGRGSTDRRSSRGRDERAQPAARPTAADRARPAVRARAHRLRGAAGRAGRASSARRARARPRRPT